MLYCRTSPRSPLTGERDQAGTVDLHPGQSQRPVAEGPARLRQRHARPRFIRQRQPIPLPVGFDTAPLRRRCANGEHRQGDTEEALIAPRLSLRGNPLDAEMDRARLPTH